MRWKLKQLRLEENPESACHNLVIDSIGWHIPNYQNDKIMKDIIFNLAKKIYSWDNSEYAVKLFALPGEYEVSEKIEELEIMFAALEKRSKK